MIPKYPYLKNAGKTFARWRRVWIFGLAATPVNFLNRPTTAFSQRRDQPESFAGDADGLGFRKRSQLLALVYQGRAIHSNDELPLLKDADQIGPIADCAVPNALREMEILEYSPELEEKIRRHEEISFRGQEETQIRTATVVAVSQLLERVNYLRSYNGEPKISMLELDNYLWSAGRQSALPYHITQTTAY